MGLSWAWMGLGWALKWGELAVKAKPKSFLNQISDLCYWTLDLSLVRSLSGLKLLGGSCVYWKRRRLLDEDLSVEDVDEHVEGNVEEELLKAFSILKKNCECDQLVVWSFVIVISWTVISFVTHFLLSSQWAAPPFKGHRKLTKQQMLLPLLLLLGVICNLQCYRFISNEGFGRCSIAVQSV